MKRAISLLLTAAMMFLCVTCAFAKNETVPLVIVRGMNFTGLTVNAGTPEECNVLGQITAGGVIGTLFKAAAAGAVNLNGKKAISTICDYARDIFKYYSCDKNGNSVYDVSVNEYPLSMSNYTGFENGYSNEEAVIAASIEKYGAEYTYYVNYDWRLDPFYTAEKINASVEQAKLDHGCDKVYIACASMGGPVTLAYLTKYGYESVNKLVFLSAAFAGTYVAGDALSGKIVIDPTALYNFCSSNLSQQATLWHILYKTGVFNVVCRLLNSFIKKNKRQIYDEVMLETFATMPGMWVVVLPEDYEACKQYLFNGREEEYAAIIKKADELQKMMRGGSELLKEMSRSGVSIAVFATYGLPLIPVYERAGTAGDGTLETALMAGGATVAPHGETLGDSYVALNPAKLSPDRAIDASTCLFPEYTWFVKNAPHVACQLHSGYSEMVFWALNFSGQPTVASNPAYPQFMYADSQQNVFPL